MFEALRHDSVNASHSRAEIQQAIAKELADARAKGVQAHTDGVPRMDCPYMGAMMHAWMDGWLFSAQQAHIDLITRG